MGKALPIGLLCGLLGSPVLSPSVDCSPASSFDIFDFRQLPEAENWKALFVTYVVSDASQMRPYLMHEKEIISGVRNLFAEKNINVMFLQYSTPALGHDTVRLELLTEDAYWERASAGRIMRLFSAGFSSPDKRLAQVKVWDQDELDAKIAPEEFVRDKVHTIAHELGHLLMLVHPVDGEFSLLRCQNIMAQRYDPTSEEPPCFSEDQARIMHSYLSHGQVMEAYRLAGSFDEYVSLIKRD